MSGTREPVRSKADENGTQAATNAPVKEASVVFVSVRLPPFTLPLASSWSPKELAPRLGLITEALQECRGKCQFFLSL